MSDELPKEKRPAKTLDERFADRPHTYRRLQEISAVYRYFTERYDCLDYATAQAQHLPIGSAEVESGHRHVIQKRLKVAGAWWKEINAHSTLNLRTASANHGYTTRLPKTDHQSRSHRHSGENRLHSDIAA